MWFGITGYVRQNVSQNKKLGLKSTKAEKTIGEMKEKYFSLVQMSLELRN